MACWIESISTRPRYRGLFDLQQARGECGVLPDHLGHLEGVGVFALDLVADLQCDLGQCRKLECFVLYLGADFIEEIGIHGRVKHVGSG